MAQYIDKDALVAEIERSDELNIFLIPTDKYNEDYKCGYEHALEKVRDFLDTLEVKEVDLEKEIGEYLSTYWPKEKELHPFLGHAAKHFFELGRAVSNKAQKGE